MNAFTKPSFPKNVVILAGSGMSADLGIPTYWTGDTARYGEQETEYGYSVLQHADASLWKKAPLNQYKYHKKVSEYYKSLDFEHSYYKTLLDLLDNTNYFVATTNVDSGFIRAGFDSHKVLELHGSYRLWQSSKTGSHNAWNEGAYKVSPDDGSIPRPHIMFFDDNNFFYTTQETMLINKYAGLHKVFHPNETLVLVIGVGETVPRLYVEAQAWHQEGFTVVRVDPREFFDEEDTFSFHLQMTAKDFIESTSSSQE